MKQTSRTPHAVDIHVGARVRMRRRELHLSQQDLADKLRLTFQQVQKYERGANRVSASKLYEIAAFLDAPIGFFFQGLSIGLITGERPDPMAALMMERDGPELATIFPRLTGHSQLALVHVARAMLELQDTVVVPVAEAAA